MSSSPQFSLIAIIGSAGLVILGVILVLSLDTPIYGYVIIGATLLGIILYILYKQYNIYKTRKAAIQAVVTYDKEIFGVTTPHSIQLERI